MRILNKKKKKKKNLENLRTFLAELGFGFQIICLTESSCSADADNESIYGLPHFTSVDQVRNRGQGGGICIFLHDSLILQPDLSINNEEMEVFSIKIINKNSKNILIST